MFLVGHFAQGGAAVDVDLADLTGAQAHLESVSALASQRQQVPAERAIWAP